MSDMRKLAEAKKAIRDKETLEQRHIRALEEIADSLEGIRQDLMGFIHAYPTLNRQKP
jgi:hypothetical protein